MDHLHDRRHTLRQDPIVHHCLVNKITCLVSIITLGALIMYALFFRGASKCTRQDSSSSSSSGGNRTVGVTDSDKKKERFSLSDARGYVQRVTALPEDFKRYKFDLLVTTDVHSEWNAKTDTLSKMCQLLIQGLAYAVHNGGLFDAEGAVCKQPTNDARLAIAVTENFIERFKSKLVTVQEPKPNPPWGGGDCFTFVSVVTAMLAHYLLLERFAALKDVAVGLILELILDPSKMINNQAVTDGIDRLALAGPWALAKYLKGEADTAVATDGYKTAMQSAKLATTHVKTDDGLHMDHSYYTQNRVSYDKLARLCDAKFTFVYGFDSKLARTPLTEWAAVRNIIMHPTLKCGNVHGLLSKEFDANESSEYGIKVMPFSGYIRYFTEGSQFSVRAQKSHLAGYVADAANKDMAQYWIQYRNVHDAKSPTAATFPNVGFVCKKTQKTLTQITPASGETTLKVIPTGVKSFVAAYKQFGVMYQEYKVSQLGDFAVHELVVINASTKAVEVSVKIVNGENDELVYYGAGSKVNAVPGKTTKSFVTTWSMVSDGAVAETKDLTAFPTFPYTLASGVVIKEVAVKKSYFVYDSDVPVVWMPLEWNYELPNLVYAVDNDTRLAFTFDAKVNQYVNVSR